MALTDDQLKIMLDTASFLNSQLQMTNDQNLKNKTLLKTNKLKGLQTVLQDIKDATETYNREFMEKEKELRNNPNPKAFNSLQDWSLFIMFSGYALFSLFMFIYIIRFSTAPLLLSVGLIIVSTIIVVLLTFLIQRYA
jgi:hypothetical protein